MRHLLQSTLSRLPYPVSDLDHYLALAGVAPQTGIPVLLIDASRSTDRCTTLSTLARVARRSFNLRYPREFLSLCRDLESPKFSTSFRREVAGERQAILLGKYTWGEMVGPVGLESMIHRLWGWRRVGLEPYKRKNRKVFSGC